MSQGKVETGTIELPTPSAVALWNEELCGQFSDGMWENAGPWEHWKFWCRLEAKCTPGVCRVTTDRAYECKKTGYNIAALYPIVGERMLEVGQRSFTGTYTMRELRSDVKAIKAAMKTVAR